MDQGVPTGDIAAQIQLIDEKINTQKEYIKSERENINSARATMAQMDAQVSARLDRGTSEASAERSVQIRAQQKRERASLTKEINDAQERIEEANKKIATLNEERAPIASKFRKVEAEVGPIKYIAALIYGDNPDTATLERAVRWVIILLIFVFDPLALMLVIAAISSYKWEFELKEEQKGFVTNVSTGYIPLDPTERETGLTPFVEPVEEKPQVLPRVFGKPVENHKANIEPALGMGMTVEVTEQPKVKKAAVKKSLALAQKALQKLQSEVSQIKNKLKQKLQKSNQAVESPEQSLSQLKQRLSWNQLTNWNNSPVLKLFNNLKNKLQKKS
jgi:predicted  nucleic acid-binding Zn-ribbon protein